MASVYLFQRPVADTLKSEFDDGGLAGISADRRYDVEIRIGYAVGTGRNADFSNLRKPRSLFKGVPEFLQGQKSIREILKIRREKICSIAFPDIFHISAQLFGYGKGGGEIFKSGALLSTERTALIAHPVGAGNRKIYRQLVDLAAILSLHIF